MPEIKPGQLIQLMFPEKVFSEKELKENEYKFLGTENIDGEEVYVSPWYWGQVLEITQS